jgi:glycosyltransferase involved in cell wall biosynthesis
MYGGISRYFYELVCELNETKSMECEIPLLISNNHYISQKDIVRHLNFLPKKIFRGQHRIFNFINRVYSNSRLKKQNFDVFHPTYYDTYFLENLNDKPFVLTVHDMIHEKFCEMFPLGDKTRAQKKILAGKATKIIAISHSTKNDLINLLGIEESKIEVVYHGHSILPRKNINPRFDIPKKYLLFVGSRGGYKNFDRFIISAADILTQEKNLYIFCAGGGQFSNKEMCRFFELGIEKQVLQHNINDEDLAYLYKYALAFVYPSLYEGFGIPILESFACNCPVICSDTSSLPEISKDAAKYFNPSDEESIRNAILQVLSNNDIRQTLSTKGKKRLAKFSWEITAEKTKKIYESILK